MLQTDQNLTNARANDKLFGIENACVVSEPHSATAEAASIPFRRKKRTAKKGLLKFVLNRISILSILPLIVLLCGTALVYVAQFDPFSASIVTLLTGALMGMAMIVNRFKSELNNAPDLAMRERFEALEDKAWELRESEERYRTLAEAFGDMVILRDSGGHITYANEAYTAAFGSEEQAENNSRRLPPDFSKQLQSKASPDVVDTNESKQKIAPSSNEKVISFLGPNGIRWLQWIDLAVRDEKNGGTGTLSVARDITIFKRSSELDANARKKAEQASKAKNKFLAMVSHEMRTPLNGIIGMSKLLNGTKQTAEQNNYTNALENSGKTLLSLIEGMLDLTMIEGGKFVLKKEEFDLRNLINETSELLAQRAYEKDIGFGLVVSPNVPKDIVTDAGRLRQIIYNLAGNAIKFTATGGVSLKVTLRPCDISKSQNLLIEINDTGAGISKEDRDRIFEEFERVDDDITRKVDGAGLGLAISKALIAQLGGEIRLAKTGAAGSVFEIEIGFDKLGIAPQRLNIAPEKALSGHNVWMVSENQTEAECISDIVKSRGAQFQQIHFDEIKQKGDVIVTPPNHIFFDPQGLKAPFKAFLGLRRRFPDQKIHVVLTAAEKKNVEHYIANGADGWLTRPVREASIIANLTKRVKSKVEDKGHNNRGPVTAPTISDNGQFTETTKCNINVLLAEDNDVNALLVTAALRKVGVNVCRANNGKEALAAFSERDKKFDLVLMDLHMPIMDGISAIKAFRAHEAQQSGTNAEIKIFALSADEQEDSKQAVLDAGANGFLSKPIDPADLTQLVAQTVSNQKKSAA